MIALNRLQDTPQQKADFSAKPETAPQQAIHGNSDENQRLVGRHVRETSQNNQWLKNQLALDTKHNWLSLIADTHNIELSDLPDWLGVFDHPSRRSLSAADYTPGNHSPLYFDFSKLQLPAFAKKPPHQMVRLVAQMVRYYFNPEAIPALSKEAAAAAKQAASQAKKRTHTTDKHYRSEAREVQSLIAIASIMRVNWGSMRLGYQCPDTDQHVRVPASDIAWLSGQVDSSGLPTRAFWSGWSSLRDSGMFEVSHDKRPEKLSNGRYKYRSKVSIKKVSRSWLEALGVLTTDALDSLIHFYGKKYQKARQGLIEGGTAAGNRIKGMAGLNREKLKRITGKVTKRQGAITARGIAKEIPGKPGSVAGDGLVQRLQRELSYDPRSANLLAVDILLGKATNPLPT